MKVSDMLVKALEDQGIEIVLGVPGEENADFMQSLEASSKIRFILTHDETQAGMMGVSYGTLTHKPVAIVATLGPGATNVATAVGQATQDGSPLILIVGQGSTCRLDRDSHQIMDQMKFFEPIAKRAVSIREPNLVSGIVHKAVKAAISGKPGAVVIELPEDVAKLEGDYRELPKAEAVVAISFGSKTDAVRMIRSSTKPVILIGAGVSRGGASHVVRKLADKTGFPVVNTMQGKGVIPEGNTVGFMDKSGLEPIKEADLIIAIGYGQVEVAAEKLGLNGKKIINISVVETSADPIYIPDIELVGNIETIIAKLTQKL